MVLLASFVKKAQRPPRASIELAERRLAEWSEGNE